MACWRRPWTISTICWPSRFPGVTVVVKDQVIGYRRKKDLFVLLVESFRNGTEISSRFGDGMLGDPGASFPRSRVGTALLPLRGVLEFNQGGYFGRVP